MPGMRDKLRFVRDGGQTLRYHTVSRIEPERVGQHSFGVAWLCYLLEGGKPSANLLMAALAHDTPEWLYGDIPSPSKAMLGIGAKCEDLEHELFRSVGLEPFALHQHEHRVLKLADLADGMLSCVCERALGNKLVERCYTKFSNYAWGALKRPHGGVVRQEMELDHPVAVELLDTIEELWQEANQ